MVAHFRDLLSHRVPVLQLYRRILRHSYHLPLEPEEKHEVHDMVSQRFRPFKNVMSSYAVRSSLLKGYEWEEIFRRSIEEPHISEGDSQDGISSELNSGGDTPNKWTQQIRSVLDQHHQKLLDKAVRKAEKKQEIQPYWIKPKSPLEKAVYKRYQHQVLARQKMQRFHEQSHKLLSSKAPLDPLYVNCILFHEFKANLMKQRYMMKRKLQTQHPLKTHLSYVNTPQGRVHFLRLPWVQSERVSGYLRAVILSRFTEKLNNLNWLLALANYQAAWELQQIEPNRTEAGRVVTTKTSSSSEVVDQWTLPVKQAIQDLQNSRLKFIEKAERQRMALVARKRQYDRVFQGKFERKLLRWAERDKRIRYYAHDNVRSMLRLSIG